VLRPKSFTAKNAEDAEEEKSFTAKKTIGKDRIKT